MLIDPEFAEDLNQRQAALRQACPPWPDVPCADHLAWRGVQVVVYAVQSGVSTPAFSASLAYYDSYRRDRLPANLTQAGAPPRLPPCIWRRHSATSLARTYERVDKPGSFHTEWLK